MSACNHRYHDCPEHPGYKRCVNCGTFKSTVAPPAIELYTADYWTHEAGHSTLEEQIHNCEVHLENGVSKNDFILSLIAAEDRRTVLEIGCSPGALLGRLRETFTTVIGMDVLMCPGFVTLGGFFPEAARGLATGGIDCIIGSDVFEHSHHPQGFVMECARLLKEDGQLLLMLPLVRDDIPERMFNPTEHVYLWSEDGLTRLLSVWGFTDIRVSRWCPGHECISAHWRARPADGLREMRTEPINYDEDGEGNCLPCP